MAKPIRFLTGVVLLTLSIQTVAQVSSDPRAPDMAVLEEEEPRVLQRISVTGYHIKRIDQEGPAPVVVYSRADLEQAGINTLEEFARYLPLNWSKPVLRFDTVGAAAFDLRGIGVDSTLTLVNGLRIAPYAQSAENYIDVNAIPVSRHREDRDSEGRRLGHLWRGRHRRGGQYHPARGLRRHRSQHRLRRLRARRWRRVPRRYRHGP